MIALAWAHLRASWRRLIPAGIAVALGTGFVTITLLGGEVMTRSTYQQVTATYGSADLLVSGEGLPFTETDLTTVRQLPGVTAADFAIWGTYVFSNDVRSEWVITTLTPSDPALSTLSISAGRMPQTATEIALTQQVIERFDAKLGDTLNIAVDTQIVEDAVPPETAVPQEDGATPTASVEPAPTQTQTIGAEPTSSATAAPKPSQVTIVGVVEDPQMAYSAFGGVALVTLSCLQQQNMETWEIIVKTDDIRATQTALTDALPDTYTDETQDIAADQLSMLTNGTNLLVVLVLIFAAIALLVATLVITNTFEVLTAQRTAVLATLRCIGATRRQVYLSVLLESGLLGLLSSTIGVLTAVLVARIGLSVVRKLSLDFFLIAELPVTLPALLVPMAVGVCVSAVAGLSPALAASTISPIAASRPRALPSLKVRAGRIRLFVIGSLGLGGVTTLIVSVIWSMTINEYDNSHTLLLLLGMLGSGLTLIAVLVSASYWAPGLLWVIENMWSQKRRGRGTAGQNMQNTKTSSLNATAHLAMANARRNPRRTGTTSAALVLGVALVVTMSTGAASAQSSLDKMVVRQFPVDVDITNYAGSIPPEYLARLETDPQLEHQVQLPGAWLTVDGSSGTLVLGLDPEEAKEVVADQEMLDVLKDGGAVAFLPVGSTLNIVAPTGEHIDLVVGMQSYDSSVIIPEALLMQIQPKSAPVSVWGNFATDVDPIGAVDSLTESYGDVVQVYSPMVERLYYKHLIDIMLAVFLALVAVAVVIAFIGVANTLSLSVLERRHELATLRAVGMTRKQVRTSLLVEGLTLAGMGTIVGSLLGLVFGWGGSALILSMLGDYKLSMPWLMMVGTALVTTGAGMLAAVLPAREALSVSPVAALSAQ